MMNIEEMTYEETVVLERLIELKNKSKEMFKDFHKYITLSISNYKGEGRFLIQGDSNNKTYVRLDSKGVFNVEFRFLHETYDIKISMEYIFESLKEDYKGVGHLRSLINSMKGKE